jgi:hypothetical protein
MAGTSPAMTMTRDSEFVMPALVAGIHVFLWAAAK